MNATLEPLELDRVRRHTQLDTNREIEEQTRINVRVHAAQGEAAVSERIRELEREWDVERTLEANASTLALIGAALGTTVSKKWFWLTGGVLTFLFQHATSGWCPPLPVLRKLGIRTQTEIDREKFALKAVRGDFDRTATRNDAEETLAAVAPESAHGWNTEREPDRVRRYTSRERLRQLDTEMAERVHFYANQPPAMITQRIAELRREWSIERYLQINVAAVGLTTAALAATKNRNWGYVTCAGLAFFLFHAIEGFDPAMPVLRRGGRRTRAEIDREIYALKTLRGDFERANGGSRVGPALDAVDL